MPYYFFDVTDGDRHIVDQVGTRLPDARKAKTEAAQTLAEMAKDRLPEDKAHWNIAVTVRDMDGKRILRAAITFDLEPF